MPEVTRDEPIAHFDELRNVLGPNKVYVDLPTRISHRMAHSPELLLHEDRTSIFTPDLVVTPESTLDVVEVVKIANKHRLPLIPQGGRIGTQGSGGRKGAVVVSLHRMNKILEFDEENEWVVVEPGITVDHLGEFLRSRGYVQMEWPATRSARIGGRVGTDGYNRFNLRWGRTKDNVLAVEVVLPDGSVGEFGEGSCGPVKSALGFNLKDIIVGSRGTLGIVTKITLKAPKLPPVEDWGYSAFSTPEDMIRALIDVSRDPITNTWTWRLTGSPRWVLEEVFKTFMNRSAPEGVGAVLDYNVFGDADIIEITRKRLHEIFHKYGGFISDALGPEREYGRAAYTNRDIAINRFAALARDRSEAGGKGGLWLPVDPVVPNNKAVEYITRTGEICRNWAGLYPYLSKRCKFLPGIAVNASLHYVFFYGVFVFDMPTFDKEAREEFMRFYREHADLVHQLGGSTTYVHGFAPREVEVNMVKEEMGEAGFEFVRKIKQAIDPNNIMNPYVRFSYDADPVLQDVMV